MHPDEAQRDHPAPTTFRNRIDQTLRDLIQVGHVNEIHLAPGPTSEEVRWPLRLGALPALAASRQRRALDERLSAALGAPDEATCQILSGMGGAGKTQAAAEYAHRQWRAGEVDLLVWANAASRDAVLAAYARAAAEVCGADSDDIEANAAAFHAWLDRPTGRRWLMVLDDVSDPTDLNGLWPPANPHGRTLVTTRRRDAALDGSGRSRMDVDLFSASESRQFLERRLGGDSDLLRGADDLAAALGFLPLALAQAAAYVLDQPGMTCDDYHELLTDRSIALTHLRPDSLPDGHDRAVTAVWSLSIERVDSLAPAGAASTLLRMMSLLDPNGMPTALLAGDAAVRFVAEATESAGLSAMAVRRMLGRLDRMSLIDHTGDLVRVHALIQRAVFETISARDLPATARAVADALAEAWPDPDRYAPVSAVMRSNAAYLSRCARRALLDPDIHEVLFKAGDSLGNHGATKEAMAHFELLHAEAAFLGAEHPDVLRARHRKADWQKAAGDLTGALRSLASLVSDCTEYLGAAHPHTLRARSSLADRRGENGDAQGAASDWEALVADHARLFGPDHPSTLSARLRLVRWGGQARDKDYAVTAVAELRKLVPEFARCLGPDHVGTFTARAGLARWQGRSGDTAGAVEGLTALLADRTRVLGLRHPDTLNTKYHLAIWTGRAGRTAEAIAILEDLIPELAEVHGPTHPRTHRAKAGLACWHGEAGDTGIAIAEFTELLPVQSAAIGADHPFVLESRHNLGKLQAQAGDTAAAIATLTSVIADRTRLLGPDHPLTRAAGNDLDRLR